MLRNLGPMRLEESRQARALWSSIGPGRVAGFLVAAWAVSACGSSFREAPSDASSDATDAGTTESGGKDGGGVAEASTEAGIDGAVCPQVASSKSLCRGYLDYESACQLYGPCDCTYWANNCSTLSSEYDVTFEADLAICATDYLLMSACPSVDKLEGCAYEKVVAKPGLSTSQTELLADYCLMCDPTVTTACMTDPEPFAAKFNDPTTSSIRKNCTGPGRQCSDFEACVNKTLMLNPGCGDSGT
jgi:hypothetical protein